ncbi:MAG: hypothetical protein JO359_03565 [Candidatus Eremiobacteraeota bacterium]|nr:hypothetical protein [Candidatus Eremiobacteraeota bacterium]
MLHALAFVVWDIGTRPPSRLFAQVGAGFRSARTLARGIWRFVLGALLLVAGALLMLSVTVADVRSEFTILESSAIVAGLLIEILVGDPIRAHLTNR